MAISNITKKTLDNTRLGECAAAQPVSGIGYVNATFAVSGLGCGGVVPKEQTEKDLLPRR